MGFSTARTVILIHLRLRGEYSGEEAANNNPQRE